MTECADANGAGAAAFCRDREGRKYPAPRQTELSGQMLALEAMMERHWTEERLFLRQLRFCLEGEAVNPAEKFMLPVSEPKRLVPKPKRIHPATFTSKPLQQLSGRFVGSWDDSVLQLTNLASDEQAVIGAADARPVAHMLKEYVLADAEDSAADKGRLKLQDSNPMFSLLLRSSKTLESLRLSWMSHHNVGDSSRSWVKRLVSCPWYETFSCTIVIVNAMFVGLQTEATAEHALEIAVGGNAKEFPLENTYQVIQGMFTFVFTLDLTLRWIAHGPVQFWRQKEMGWNLLDLIVVVAGMFDIAMELSGALKANSRGPDVAMGSLSLFRLLRLLRIVRVARIIRVARFFRDLRLMIASILYSGKSFMWALVVVLMLLYMASVIFTGAVSAHITGIDRSEDEIASLMAYFGTLYSSTVSLLMTMTGGADWEQFYRPVQALGHPFDWLFVLFILVSQFAVLNLVTGVFMSNTLNACARDAKLMVQEEMDGMRDNHTILKQLFKAMDRDGSGILTREKFQERVSDPEVSALFKSIHLHASDANLLFDLLDRDRASEVSVREFVPGCYALMGDATSFDAKVLRVEVSSLLQAVHGIETLLKEQAPRRVRSAKSSRREYKCSL